MTKIRLEGVRLSFPSIFQKAKFEGVEGKYEATFLIPKSDTETKAKIDDLIAAALKESNIKVPKDKICLKDGDDFEYDGYADHWAFKASSKKRPPIIDRDKSALTEEDGKPYAGCYVTAIVDVWVQNNGYGKRVNGNLHGIQFVDHGDAFGDGGINIDDEFEDLDDI